MTCLTAPGSGKDLLWNVTVAGQTSPILTTRPTSYAAPVTGTFTGPGSNLAKTYGYEMVYIGGASALLRSLRSRTPHALRSHNHASCVRSKLRPLGYADQWGNLTVSTAQ